MSSQVIPHIGIMPFLLFIWHSSYLATHVSKREKKGTHLFCFQVQGI